MSHSIEPFTTSSPVKELKGPALFVLKGNNLQEKERKKNTNEFLSEHQMEKEMEKKRKVE